MMSSVRRRGPAADNTSPGLPESDNNYLQSDDEKIKFRILIKFGNLINLRRGEQRSEFYQESISHDVNSLHRYFIKILN